MTVDFRIATINVPDGTGRRNLPGSVTFGNTVNRANVALNGFRLTYTDDDHHVTTVEADVDFVSLSGNRVNFNVECDYRDKNADDQYNGYVSVLVVADVV